MLVLLIHALLCHPAKSRPSPTENGILFCRLFPCFSLLQIRFSFSRFSPKTWFNAGPVFRFLIPFFSQVCHFPLFFPCLSVLFFEFSWGLRGGFSDSLGNRRWKTKDKDTDERKYCRKDKVLCGLWKVKSLDDWMLDAE